VAVVLNEPLDGTNGVSLSTGNVSIATAILGAGTATFDTSLKHEGTSAAHFQTSASGTPFGTLRALENTTASTATTRYFSFYIYPTASPSANTTLHYLGASAASRSCQLVFNTTRTFKIQNQGAILIGANTTSVIPLNEWTRIDWSLVGSTVKLEVYPGNANCDSVVNNALPGDTVVGTTTPPANPLAYQFLGVGAASTNDFYLDAFRADDASLPGPSVASAQTLAPATDITTSGWTVTGGTGTYSSALDETVADDGEFVTSPNNPTSSVFETKVSTGVDPGVDTGHAFDYRIRSNSAASSTVVIGLYQGGTLIASETRTSVPASFTTYTMNLTTPQAAAITDYTNLRLRFTATAA
jgi:hypothetical protein